MCIGLLLSIFSCSIYAQSEAIPINDYVNDYAGILSSEKEEELNQAGKEFEEKTGSNRDHHHRFFGWKRSNESRGRFRQ